MKHLLGVELACRKALAMAVLEQFIHLGPCFVKTPKVKIGTRDSLLSCPESTIQGRRLPLSHAPHPFREPNHGFQIEAVIVFEQTSGPNRGHDQPVLDADSLTVQIAGGMDARALINVYIKMTKHPFNENRNGHIAE